MAYTQDQFHISQVLATNEAPRVVRKASLGIFSLGMALYILTAFPSHPLLKFASMLLASGAVNISLRLDKLERMLSPYEEIAHQQSVTAYKGWLGHAMKPPIREASIVNVEPPKNIPVSDIKKALAKPHLLVLGETNSGKSTLVKYLVSQCSAPSIVLDSHAAPDDWQGMKVIGAGRDYKAIGLEVARLVKLMDDRYKARDAGQKRFDTLLVILDEFPACVANLGKSFTESIMLLVREARKVGIKLIILSQGSEVKTLGIEGQGSIRECFAIVSLGKFAVAAAKSLKDDAITQKITAAQHPAMLDDLPCELPIIDNFVLPNFSLPADYLELTGVDTLTEIDDLTSVDRIFDTPKTLNPVINPSTVKMSKQAQAILDYARRQDKFITASQVKAGVRIFREGSVHEIRNYFQWLADENLGIVQGDKENLEFSAN